MTHPAPSPAVAANPNPLAQRYRAVRARTLALCQGLTAEDCQVQSMADASPAKWHLAHTTWFFETFVLAAQAPAYRPWRADCGALFNSYYLSLGAPYPRPQRGLLTRPGLEEIREYRSQVDEALLAALAQDRLADGLLARVELGLQHEQQHQELLLTDIKHAFSCNPLLPAYRAGAPELGHSAPLAWQDFAEAVVDVGHAGPGFAFDNERPRHRVVLPAFRIASRWVTNGEYREFMRDGGYRTPGLWLSDGWALVQSEHWQRPLYWRDDDTRAFTLRGCLDIDPQAPVCHLSYYEAEAFARWAGARLPREQEWERLAADAAVDGNFVESGALCPQAAVAGSNPYGNVWVWTASPYVAYPGYATDTGALGEYNGKFMCNQVVLRGGSCASPASHLRPSYRNFFPPQARWQFSGLRLAKDLR